MKKLFTFLLLFTLIFTNSSAFAADWVKTIYIFVRDQAGNIQAIPVSSSITLDTTAPVINITTNPDNTQTQTKTVRATITDTNIDNIKYIQIPTATACNWSLTFNNDYTSGSWMVLSSETDNWTKVCFRAKDLANNYTYLASNTIENIDRTAPTISVVYKNENDTVIWVNDHVTTRKVSATISDTTTGSSNFWNPSLWISPTLSAGTYSNSSECSAASYSAYSTERVFSNPVADNGKQICFKWIDPAGNTSFELVTVNLNAIPTFTSVSKVSPYINSDNETSVSFGISGITDNDNDPITIRYSWNWTTYNTLTTLSWTTSNSQSYWPFSLDTTSLPQWTNTLYIKLNDWNYDSDVKTTTIFKDSVLPVITVHNISSNTPQQAKYLSGSISDTNSFSWYIAIVDDSIWCSTQNYTISYTSGQSITIDDEAYNWKKVCFKTVDQYQNIRYWESTTITWIDKTAPVTPTALLINSWSLFTNNATINLQITHPNESDVSQWCVTEENTSNNCNWVNTKPTTYQIINN